MHMPEAMWRFHPRLMLLAGHDPPTPQPVPTSPPAPTCFIIWMSGPIADDSSNTDTMRNQAMSAAAASRSFTTSRMLRLSVTRTAMIWEGPGGIEGQEEWMLAGE